MPIAFLKDLPKTRIIRHKREDIEAYAKTMNVRYDEAKKIMSQPVAYAPYKESYAKQIIDYPESPTGRAYIGTAKLPLMKVKDGHGFMGLLTQDEERRLIQCHSCGAWKRKLTSWHLKKCCGLTSREYKKKYGLNFSPGLVSDETSLRLTVNCLKSTRTMELQNRFGKKKNNGKDYYGRHYPHVLAYSNKFGTCPEQIKYRLYEFIRANKELPTSNNRGRSIYKAITNRYKTFGDGLKAHGLPHLTRTGTTLLYVFPDNSRYKFNLNQMYDRTHLYRLMMEKCSCLTN